MFMRKTARIARDDKNTAKTRHRDPATLPFYSSKKATSQVVSAGYNALAISDRQRFTLKKYGKPFNYQGVMTKRYDLAALCRLFVASHMTIYAWMKIGYLPEPQITIANKKRMWMYHQVQPFYVWYWHVRNRRATLKGVTAEEYAILQRMQKYSDMRWHRLLGVEYDDPYVKVAGKYGVIYDKETTTTL